VIGWWFLLATAGAGEIVDATGATARADRTTRIVTVGGGITESVFALGAGPQVVGVDKTSVYPGAASKLPRVGYFRQLTAEGLISLGPELIVATDEAGPPAALDQVAAAGISVVRLSAEASVEAAEQRLRDLGTLLDRSAEAERLVASMKADLAEVDAPDRPPRVLFVYARGADTMQVGGTDTPSASMIELAGGVNAVDSYSGFKPLTAEGAIAVQPDFVLLTTRGLASVGGVAGMLAQPGIAQTPAGRARRIIAVDDLMLLGFGPRTGEAVRELADKLHGSR